jgi:membrane protein YdbS with pleckstrin-like domain
MCLSFNCRPWPRSIVVFQQGLFVFWLEFQRLISFFFLVLLLSRISFNKKGFAFRTHDVLFKHGILATNIIVIPYNRVQHVALHEGFISGILIGKIEVLLQEEAQAISKSRN